MAEQGTPDDHIVTGTGSVGNLISWGLPDGGSSLNEMIDIRGHRSDYDDWAATRTCSPRATTRTRWLTRSKPAARSKPRTRSSAGARPRRPRH
jgi:hypothetical protein